MGGLVTLGDRYHIGIRGGARRTQLIVQCRRLSPGIHILEAVGVALNIDRVTGSDDG